jgi:hypothetical protein
MPCEWCGTIFCWDFADECVPLAGPRDRKRHCSEECRKLAEEKRWRQSRQQERCERGEIPRFQTRALAAAEARILTGDTGIRHRAYDRPCPFCERWHVIRKDKHRPQPGFRGQNRR